MSFKLPKSKGHRTLAARMCEAMANDLMTAAQGLREAAKMYRDAVGHDKVVEAKDLADAAVSYAKNPLWLWSRRK